MFPGDERWVSSLCDAEQRLRTVRSTKYDRGCRFLEAVRMKSVNCTLWYGIKVL